MKTLVNRKDDRIKMIFPDDCLEFNPTNNCYLSKSSQPLSFAKDLWYLEEDKVCGLTTEDLVGALMERSRQEYPEDYYTDPGTGELEDHNEDQRFAYVRGFTHGVEASLATGWRPSEAQMEALDAVYKTHSMSLTNKSTILSLINDLKKLNDNGKNTQA